jgi:hypothetical protein
MAIISISGRIGSGKDLIGQIIQYLTDKNVTTETFEFWYASNFYSVYQDTGKWKIKKFADKLKDIVCLLINCTREQLEDREFKEKELGEEWNKNIYDAFDRTKILRVEKLTPRLLLQLLGTEWGRNIIHPNIWVNTLMSEYISLDCKNVCAKLDNVGHECMDKSSCVYNPNWIITDVRFPNELEAVKEKKGISIRVNRDRKGFTNQKLLAELHPSETALNNAEFDYVIDNNGSISDLIDKVQEILIKERII